MAYSIVRTAPIFLALLPLADGAQRYVTAALSSIVACRGALTAVRLLTQYCSTFARLHRLF